MDRAGDWKKFSDHMAKYIERETVGKYQTSAPGVDLVAITNSPLVCAWNILKYGLRVWNGRDKPHDLEKIAHYASMAWSMATATQEQAETGDPGPGVHQGCPGCCHAGKGHAEGTPAV